VQEWTTTESQEWQIWCYWINAAVALTVSAESLFLSCVIDAKEHQKVMTCDIPGAFMQAHINNVLHIPLEGPLAKLLTKMALDLYNKFLGKENGRDVMYVHLTKVIYDTLQAALFYWKDMSGYLVEQGFILNPINNCISNKMIDGTQCTILNLKPQFVPPRFACQATGVC
jgi:hypothetical protein